MTYIAYNKMNPAEQLLFNSTGKVDEKYLLTDAEWEAELAKINDSVKVEPGYDKVWKSSCRGCNYLNFGCGEHENEQENV